MSVDYLKNLMLKWRNGRMSTEEKIASIFTEIDSRLDLDFTDLTPESNLEYIVNLAQDSKRWKSTEEEFRRNALNLATWCVELVYQLDSDAVYKEVIEQTELETIKQELERTKALHENLKNTIAQSDANRVALKDENEELKSRNAEANKSVADMALQYNLLLQDYYEASSAAKKSSKRKK